LAQGGGGDATPVMVKRKGEKSGSKATKVPKKASLEAADGELASDDEDSDIEPAKEAVEEEDGFFETPDEKRIRLAKEYLERLEEAKPGQVQETLVEDVKEKTKRATAKVLELSLGEPRYFKGHLMAPTSLCMRADEAEIFTGGKDCGLLRWDVETGKKIVVHPGGKNRFECGGHFASVNGVAWVEQKQLLLSGGMDRVLRVWDVRLPPKSACVDALLGHEGPINAVVVDPVGDRAYTVSADKTLKMWDIRRRRIMDTLMGHVGQATCLDIYSESRPVSGGVDKTVRLWKVAQDTHLIFSRHTYPVDAVVSMDFSTCISGSQDGSLMLWTQTSKKPLAKAQLDKDQWVTALGCIRASNVSFSGSSTGELRPWQSERGEDTPVRLVPAGKTMSLPGCINAIAVGQRYVACAVGKEQKLGRWHTDRGYRNGLVLIPLSYKTETLNEQL